MKSYRTWGMTPRAVLALMLSYILRSKYMDITVYMEHGSSASIIAKFIDEETYMVCVPALEALAKKYNSTISESMEEE
jgi:hypothetical protein